MKIEDVNHLSASDFLQTFGFLYEHSPWVVEEVEKLRPFENLAEMQLAMTSCVNAADETARLALLKSHPELAGKEALDNALTSASEQEQASAGLDKMTAKEYSVFADLNQSYKMKFGFPFIVCVRLTDKQGIMSAMQRRVNNTLDEELKTSLSEVEKIVKLRSEAIVIAD